MNKLPNSDHLLIQHDRMMSDLLSNVNTYSRRGRVVARMVSEAFMRGLEAERERQAMTRRQRRK